MADSKAEQKKKTKLPTALKRNIQSQKRRKINRSFEASVQTEIRKLNQALSDKEGKETLKEKLNTVFSLMDKGVKRGVYKAQKAARTKSRLSLKASS